MLNSLQNLPHEYLRKKTTFSPIVAQIRGGGQRVYAIYILFRINSCGGRGQMPWLQSSVKSVQSVVSLLFRFLGLTGSSILTKPYASCRKS